MGREARRPRDPNALTSFGHAAAMTVARYKLVMLLSRDQRVMQWGKDWLDRIKVQMFMRVVLDNGGTALEAARRVFEYFADGSDMSDEDFESLSALLRDMGVPWVDVRALLTVELRAQVCNYFDPDGAKSRKKRWSWCAVEI